MENPFKSLEDTKAETKTVIDGSVIGIETPLDMIFIASQDGRESDQEDPSGHKDSATPLLDKGKAKDSMPQDYRIKKSNRWIRIPIGTARVCKIPPIMSPRLLKKD